MKILDIALITSSNPNPSMRDAIASLGNEVYVYDWIKALKGSGKRALNEYLLHIVNNVFRPDIIFMQIQSPDVIDINTIKQIKSLPKPPIIINWTGDVRQPLPQWYIDMGKVVDLTLFTNDADVYVMRSHNLSADYLQVGFENTIFKAGHPKKQWPEIVFMGTNYKDRFPLSQERVEMVNLLRNRYKGNFQVYGHNWNTKFLNIEDENDCYRSCKIAINQNHYHLPRFSSDRIFRIMGSGAMCLSYHYDGIEKEFEVGYHLDTWKTFDELMEKIDHYLKWNIERKVMAIRGCEHVHENHTWMNRMGELKNILYDRKLLTRN